MSALGGLLFLSITGCGSRHVRGAIAVIVVTIASFVVAPLAARDGPSALLEDAIEAMTINKRDLATQLFGQILAEFPGTPESARANAELKAMGALAPAVDPRAAESNPRGQGVEGARAESLRRDFLLNVGDRVFFAENSASIGGRARAMIENQARWLKRRRDVYAVVIGRADDGGAHEDAEQLSRRRAEAVRDRLISFGVEAERIQIDARGDGDKVAVCQTFMCKAQNRHVETLITNRAFSTGSADVDRSFAQPLGTTAQSAPAARIDGFEQP